MPQHFIHQPSLQSCLPLLPCLVTCLLLLFPFLNGNHLWLPTLIQKPFSSLHVSLGLSVTGPGGATYPGWHLAQSTCYLTEEYKRWLGEPTRIWATFPDWDTFKQAHLREYPNARKPFISLADLGKFVDNKSMQEIHTLDEFATFHWELRRLTTRLAKEKRVSSESLNRAYKKFILTFETKFCSIFQTKRHLVSKERLFQSNMSGKGSSIYWKFQPLIQDVLTYDFI